MRSLDSELGRPQPPLREQTGTANRGPPNLLHPSLGGGDGIRTRYLMLAKHALSQLCYSPEFALKSILTPITCSQVNLVDRNAYASVLLRHSPLYADTTRPNLVELRGFEPRSSPCHGPILPLNYSPKLFTTQTLLLRCSVGLACSSLAQAVKKVGVCSPTLPWATNKLCLSSASRRESHLPLGSNKRVHLFVQPKPAERKHILTTVRAYHHHT